LHLKSFNVFSSSLLKTLPSRTAHGLLMSAQKCHKASIIAPVAEQPPALCIRQLMRVQRCRNVAG
jgi:hypothetical protein